MCNTVKSFYTLTVLNLSVADMSDIRAKLRIVKRDVGYNFRFRFTDHEVTISSDRFEEISYMEDILDPNYHNRILFAEDQY